MKLFDTIDRAGARAFQTVQKSLGAADPQVEIYRKLKPQDFQAIAGQYGPEGLIRYVEAMEARSLKGGRDGTAR